MKNSNFMNKEFYKGKKVLLTGDSGFKGAWFSAILNYIGADVLGVSLPAEAGSLYQRIHGESLVKHIDIDIRDFESLEAAVKAFKPEIVFHLAAFGFMKECYQDPLRAYGTNVLGTANLLQSIRACNSVKSIVIVSTDKVYLNKGDGEIYQETDLLGGLSPYSSSKTCMEYVVRDYMDTYFEGSSMGVVIARASNVLAGGDHIRSRLIPSILEAIDCNRAVEIRNPSQTRPWQSVIDALDGYMTIGRLAYKEPEKYSGEWNIGPMKDGIKSVQWVYDTMKNSFAGLTNEIKNEFDFKESATLGLDISRMLIETDWEPRLSCEKVIHNVVEFYLCEKHGERVSDICKKQIMTYYGECAQDGSRNEIIIDEGARDRE